MEMQAGEYCKTVGSAYVGSNPTPATTTETARTLRKRDPVGRFLLVAPGIRVCHPGSIRGDGYGPAGRGRSAWLSVSVPPVSRRARSGSCSPRSQRRQRPCRGWPPSLPDSSGRLA
jgi:hypothetical protein